MMMKAKTSLALALSALAFAAVPASAQQTFRSPEGALMDTGGDIGYPVGALSEAQLHGTTRHLFRQTSANVFRRFPREMTEQMVNFYVNALSLRSLNPIQLTSTQQMILTGVGSGQVKLAAGQQGDRTYDLSGGVTGGTGIRYLRFTYPDAAAVAQRFTTAGFTAPQFRETPQGSQALVNDPAGLPILIVIEAGAQDHSDDGVGVGIGVADLARSQEFYRDFVGLDELAPERNNVLGVMVHPFNHQQTTIYLHQVAAGLPADNGSSGIQYVVSDTPFAAAMAAHRNVAVETPLNRLRGFDLTTVWLNDPDGVTNYYAQVGPASRTARGQN
jgi:catechol 2,3-dioxygenase-like lactoylglutathione lyase family enzyme